MNQIVTPFEGLFLFEPTVHADTRGYFMESFRESFFEELGLSFIQDNEARSSYGVIRGLH